MSIIRSVSRFGSGRITFALLLLVLLGAGQDLVGQNQRHPISGRVTDASGAVLPSADVIVRRPIVGFEQTTKTNSSGEYSVAGLLPGDYEVSARVHGFSVRTETIRVPQVVRWDVALTPGVATEEVTVVGTALVSNEETEKRVPGSVDVIEPATLEVSRVHNFSEALRKATGVNVRDEEGFGLRPNIGIRGLNPTRSSKVLLLEDGVPLAYAPYGDNASYYHPPIERYRGIEVLKGSGQIMYGPSTVGGVINYITPEPPDNFGGSVTLLGGNRDYLNGHILLGGTWKKVGLLADYMRKQGDGARDNTHSKLDDFNFKAATSIGTRQTISFKVNRYAEDSNVTYSGLRLDEYQADPRQNPFKNDFFYGNRFGASIRHTYAINSRMLVATNAYGSQFSRDWWRQSSNSGQRPNDKADAACGGMANLNTTCGNEGRLRDYTTWGVEPRLRISWNSGPLANETDLGVRVHFETQERRQQNGATPYSRSGVVVENNRRTNEAYSAFVQNKFLFGKFTITPGARVERVFFDRLNRLGNNGTGAQGRTDLTQVVPGIGVAYNANDAITVFAGVHRGFAPPRTEDVISNTGGVVELDPELSWNYELGVRTLPLRGVRFDATFFRMDYENQIIPASLAGGIGAALTNAGETLHQGMEISSRLDLGTLVGSRHNVYVRTAYTYLPRAEFVGKRFSNVSGFNTVLITGNRLPYAPKNLLNMGFGYSHTSGIDVLFEAVHLGDQFGDDLNTIASTADGQRGLIPASTTWNAAFNYRYEPLHSTFFVTIKNVMNDTFLVDRSRGMLPNSPRLVQGGVKYSF